MKRLSNVQLSAVVAITIEALLATYAVCFGRFGPCGPGDPITFIIWIIHMPGLLVASSLLPDEGVMTLPIAIGVTVVILMIVFFGIFSTFRRSGRRSAQQRSDA